ncbi:MAG: septum formation inhibitor Maf [Magnetococcales bacterium]|nr:septum formation inhibitor Maf [Magnetococcales bacterium]
MTAPSWFLGGKRLCLASASPRRRDLLAQAGVPCRVQPVEVDESPLPEEKAESYVTRLARAKALAIGPIAEELVLGADTVVVLDEVLLGKPASPEEARATLRLLGGRDHRVLTGVAVWRPADGAVRECIVESRVWFKDLTEEEIAAYVDCGEPLDKAGSYGLQGVGAFLVARLEGSCSGVAGLPLCESLALLQELAWS